MSPADRLLELTHQHPYLFVAWFICVTLGGMVGSLKILIGDHCTCKNCQRYP